MKKYYAKFDADGIRVTSIMSGIHFVDENSLRPFIEEGFIPITEAEQKILTAPSDQTPYMDLKTRTILFKEQCPTIVEPSTFDTINRLEQEAHKLLPSIQAGIDAENNQQRLVDIMLEIETLRGNI